MTNTVLLKRSSVANSAPTSLAYGELALNYTDGNLYYQNAANAITVIASNKFVNVTGNVTANYFIGDGSQLTGITSNVTVGGANTSVQFNDNGALGGVSGFTFNKTANTLAVANVSVTNSLKFSSGAGGNISFAVANTANNVAFIVPVTSGTSKQVVGVIDQGTQQLGWKTVPTYYISVGLRAGGSYLAPPAPVLRVYPVRLRDNSFINVATTQ